MVDKRTWDEFRASGLLWWINQILHTFGWAIVTEVEDGIVISAFPARVKFRGFDERRNTEGYQKVTKWVVDNVDEIYKETLE